MSSEPWQKHGFRIETDEWPIVKVHYPKEVPDDAYRALFDHYAQLAGRGDRIAWLVDMSGFNPVTSPAARRKEAAAIFEEHRAILTRASVCEARVIEGGVTRGVVTAFDWLTGNKWPCVNFAHAAEARAWIEQELRKAGIAAR